LNEVLILPRTIHRGLLVHARTAVPAEAVGILGGIGDRVTVAIPLPNMAQEGAFFADPRAQFEAQRSLGRRGLDMVAIYHSHPGGGPAMSALDRKFAAHWPVIQIVIAIRRPSDRIDEIRAFRAFPSQNHDHEVSLVLS